MERHRFVVNEQIKNDTIEISFPLSEYKINGMLYSWDNVYKLAIKTEELQKIITDLIGAYFELVNNTDKK